MTVRGFVWIWMCAFAVWPLAAVQANVRVEGFGFVVETIAEDAKAFGNRYYVFQHLPEELDGWDFTRLDGGMPAVISAEADRRTYLYVITAPAVPGINMSGWQEVDVDARFCYTDRGRTKLRLYRRLVEKGEVVEIPQGNWSGGMVVAPEITGEPSEPERDDSQVPGTVIAHSPQTSGIFIGSPGIAILGENVYLAKHDDFGPESSETRSAKTHFYRSENGGKTWEKIQTVEGLFWSSLFTHNGSVYTLGTTKQYGDVVILRSDDEGRTWTTPSDAESGLLYEGLYHTAPVPVVVHSGRIWRAMENAANGTAWGTRFEPFVMSAPVNADLLRRESWTRSDVLPGDTSWLNGEFGGWLEGNVVVDRTGNMMNILRVASPEGGRAATVRIRENGKEATFDPESDFIHFPGAASKFSIRYDLTSDKYWSLVNYVPPVHADGDAGATRNTLALVSSDDLLRWTINCVLLYHPDRSRHAFQYVDWQIEGNDIIAVSRTAFDDGLGGARNYHDANYLTFHRFENFRHLQVSDSVASPSDLRRQPD